MSKKKFNNNNTDETTVVETTEAVVDDVKEEDNVETPNTETSVDAVEETTDSAVASEPEKPAPVETPVVEKELSEVEFDEVPETTPNPIPPTSVKQTAPSPEVNGNFYVNFGDMSDRKEFKVKAAIEKCGYNHIVTATGEVLAGPFETDSDANVARKKIAGLGFKGVVFTFE